MNGMDASHRAASQVRILRMDEARGDGKETHQAELSAVVTAPLDAHVPACSSRGSDRLGTLQPGESQQVKSHSRPRTVTLPPAPLLAEQFTATSDLTATFGIHPIMWGPMGVALSRTQVCVRL